ncbi:VanZ family protein [Epilithonimonas zeae]|uniref:Glycopeptide antibiotics resistance protein n=1 Tax=Epilithonimonas zeae TaxID=1416779 RepID=A0A1N6JHA1_9FLAO|nr:VanZ family protein [Epilithonimonas zeae]SIO43768.1 Glycopeptide antibiotics resistance protein [Epilithonimonas zeae]
MKEKYQQIFITFYRYLIPFYTVFLLYLMFFGFGRSQYDINIVRLLPMISTFNFVKETIIWKTIIINVFGNVLMFTPFGFLGIVLPKLNNFRLLIFDFLFAIILVESLQYFTRLGVFDIDDVILNTVGVAIGFWMYRWLNKKFIGKDF